MENLNGYMDVNDWRLLYAMGTIILSPLYWNVIGRLEMKTKFFTSIFGSNYIGCYFIGLTILMLGFHRDYRFYDLIEAQPKSDFLDQESFKFIGTALMVVGTILVLTSYWRLGFTGTFLGDYFGILLEERVTTFPFNIFDNPMYIGSTSNFLGLALRSASPCGIIMSGFVYLVYWIGLLLEEPYTEEIYRQKNEKLT
ncbi:Phosphatidylethanolamine N-methyltransferase [Trichoplax sp. H2]|uniref:Phosphatidylethanolamine N-methyltransferase n=1 Tax=Trichoplax adhaerens TaxID=10228 RepID=B3RI13_TRIAD|nr:hypothetical protein TRIADDRAFT_19455 [Trichoplax adhaerens]EDV29686.1 hypothetical protein TRIADDRAFT_19455 [Trichoplax adhaerens]RDD47061.1 Phosphatidylethanolamine N-methyltransferase [Trichoplax sp. H2]|eukprot:XP_002108888.1 hypothetical protein TRIADDRAFT_19455 [Trichoplax adhaerens]